MTYSTPQRRQGSTLYVSVMGVGMIVGVIALTTSLTDRMLLRESEQNHLQLIAAHNARSGVEYALNWMNRTPDWRTALTSGVDTADIETGGGRFRFRVTDTDGDLSDDQRDHAVLRVVGEASEGRATYAVEVDIEPAGRALSCLEASVCSGSDIDLNAHSVVEGSGFLYAGNDISSNGGDINLDAEAAGTASGSGYNAELLEGAPAREMPSEHVFDWYVEHGTEIRITDVPYSFGQYRMDLQLLSRELNPFGDPDPRGIYWIDCQGNAIDLKWSRFLGTLVLLNAGAGMEFTDVAIYQPAAGNYPALMVQGDLSIDLRSPFTGQELREQWIFNYNPTGIPYEGVADSDRTDNRPARFDGIVYVTGTLRIDDDSDFQGNVIAGAITIDGDETLDVDYRPYSYNYPPPGFSAGQGARMLPGSYRRVGL